MDYNKFRWDVWIYVRKPLALKVQAARPHPLPLLRASYFSMADRLLGRGH